MFEMLFLDITTGLRRGELVALKWSDLNIRKAELNVSRQQLTIPKYLTQGYAYIVPTKEKPNRLKSSQKQVNNFPDKLEFVGENNMPKADEK